MQILWDEKAWEDYVYWEFQDKKTLKRINELIQDIKRSSYEGIGKPEQLREDFEGFWSRRIDERNRLVYQMDENGILYILSCRGHYIKEKSLE
ncbi:txe/YoeB family addiction module toxin [Firmicutes bacterium M10-2]|nr:txe/YoeB family addiction module toxin [Firmicutes bacterium M10-2]